VTATLRRSRLAISTMSTGLALTVVASIAPYVDRDADNGLAGHIRAGYPTYSPARVDRATDIYLAYLTGLNLLAVGCWLAVMWAVVKDKGWAFRAAVLIFFAAVAINTFNLLVKDTSGDTGLPRALGWLGLLPCLPGLISLAVLRGRRGRRPGLSRAPSGDHAA
jgi:hypothetical protein